MSTLAQELKSMFTNDERSSSMMYEECEYKPDNTSTRRVSYDRNSPDFTKTTEVSSPIDCGYAKELEQAGVDYLCVDSYGGEDQGSTYYTIYKFSRDYEVCYFQFDGWYQSFNGSEFESVFEVKPKEVTKVEYTKV